MRIISQDGTIDIPYERFIISVNMQNQGEIIAWTGNNISDDECIAMAIYSSREKAQKAMEMLREHHEKVAFLKTIINTEIGASFVRGLSENDFDKMTRNYFQFPKDEDVEVQDE